MKKAISLPTKQESSPSKRPLLISVLCIISLIVLALQYLTSFIPSVMTGLFKLYPFWYVIFTLVFFYPVGIVSNIAIWSMRRWGIYLYSATTLLVWFIMFFFLGRYPQMGAFLLSLIIISVSLAYLKRMR